MKKFIQNKLKEQKGLTLIELLAVIVILAIIAAIAIPAIGNIIENSRVGAMKSDAQNIFSAARIASTDLNDDSFTIVEGENELVSGNYIEDEGTFEDGEITSVTRNAAGDWQLSGSAVVGAYTVTFTNATQSQVEDLANNARPTTAPIAFSETP